MAKRKKSAPVKRVRNESLKMAELIISGMQEKKAHQIVTLDLRNIRSAVADYFVICHGDSDRQVEAIAKSVEEQVYKGTGEDPWHREGFRNAEWILLDYIDVVVHVFLRDKREFYGLERLWADAETSKMAGSY